MAFIKEAGQLQEVVNLALLMMAPTQQGPFYVLLMRCVSLFCIHDAHVHEHL